MKQKGFTLVETLVAIFILTLTIGAMLTLAASSFFSVRYAKSDIVANNLIQESLEYIRNSRDSAFQQGGDWNSWLASMSVCLDTNGCIVDPYSIDSQVTDCPTTCPYLTYFETATTGFYGYADNRTYPAGFISNSNPYETTYRRTIVMQPRSQDTDEYIVTAKIEWKNGNNPKSAQQSMLLSNWTL